MIRNKEETEKITNEQLTTLSKISKIMKDNSIEFAYYNDNYINSHNETNEQDIYLEGMYIKTKNNTTILSSYNNKLNTYNINKFIEYKTKGKIKKNKTKKKLTIEEQNQIKQYETLIANTLEQVKIIEDQIKPKIIKQVEKENKDKIHIQEIRNKIIEIQGMIEIAYIRSIKMIIYIIKHNKQIKDREIEILKDRGKEEYIKAIFEIKDLKTKINNIEPETKQQLEQIIKFINKTYETLLNI